MKRKTLIVVGWLLLSGTLPADTLGFVQQKFGDIHFERGKWSRTVQSPCYTYTALEDGATVDVLRYGMGNLVPLKATKGLRVTVCGDVAAFDEGFETGTPVPNRNAQK
ncbi:MAG: hypothetical protein JOY85_06315 [Acidobacteriaceae bacterium]|nr:hypothetical protein [Acidobacteriaceae bacterium]